MAGPVSMLAPMMLPPGRAILAMSPWATGSAVRATIGDFVGRAHEKLCAWTNEVNDIRRAADHLGCQCRGTGAGLFLPLPPHHGVFSFDSPSCLSSSNSTP